ncbi:hypothetical protein [Haladaptatus sp. NG-WS-4]
MKSRTETADETPPTNERDVSHPETLERWRLFGELLKLWGDAIKVWLKIIAAVLAGLAAMSKPPFH